MATKRLPTLPFLPPVPKGTVTPAYAGDLNLAINSLYRTLAQSVDEMVITASSSSLFPAARGFKRFAYDGTKLYLDFNTTSWVPIASGTAGGGAYTAGMSSTGGGGSAGTTGSGTQSLWLFPGKNVTMSGTTAAGAYSLTISAADAHSLLISGNTAGTASTYGIGSIVISAAGALTISEGSNTMTLSVPASTLQTQSTFQVPEGCFPGDITNGAGPGQGFAAYMPFHLDLPVAVSSMDAFFSIGNQTSAAASSRGNTISISAGIYNTTLGQLSSSSSSFAWTATSSSFSGTNVKRFALPWTLNITPGQYILGVWSSSASAGNALAATISQMLNIGALAWTFGGDYSVSTTAASHELYNFYGSLSVSKASLDATLAQSDLKGANQVLYPFLYFRGFATV